MIAQVILVQMVLFAGLVFVLRKILISSSYNETRRLQQLSEENAQKTQELAAKISDAENEYRKKMQKAESEARELKAVAKREAQELKDSLLSQGKAEADRILAQAINSKEEIRREIEGSMAARSLGIARKILEEVFSGPGQEGVFDSWVMGTFHDLERISPERLRAIDLGDDPVKDFDVESSHPLNAQQRMKLETVLSEKFQRAIKVRETISQHVILGIVIRAGSFVIDGSLAERFRKAAEGIG